MKFAVLLFFALALQLMGADFEIISVTITPDAEMADIKIAGNHLAQAYDFGLGTNNETTGSPKLVLTVVSKSFSDAAGSTTLTRTIHGTKRIRTPYNTKSVAGSYSSGTFVENETVTQASTGSTAKVVIPGGSGPTLYLHTVTGSPNNSNIWTGGTSSATFTPTGSPTLYGASAILPGPREFYDGIDTTIRVGLSEYVYQKDEAGGGGSGTNVTYAILSGLYGASLAGSGTATNDSAIDYYIPFGNWTIPPFQRFTGPFKLKCFVLHRDARDGRIVRLVRFTVYDGTTTVNVDALSPIIDPDVVGDDNPVIEYSGDFNASSFIQGADLICNFTAYAWTGDVAFTTVGGPAAPSAVAGPVQHLCDKNGTYGVTYALVDASTIDDSTGLAYDSSVYDPNTALPFQTLGAAARAIRDKNALSGRDNVGAGIVQMAAGNHTWLNKTVAGGYGAVPKTWLTFEPKTGADYNSVNITVASLNTNPGDRVRFNNVTLSLTTNNGFSGIDAILYENCYLDSTGTQMAGAGTYQYFVNDIIPNWQMNASGTANTPNCLTRGCTFISPFNKAMRCYMFVGNKFDGTWVHGRVLNGDVTGSGQPLGTPIWAFNKIHGVIPSGPSDVFSAGDAAAATYMGFGIVQNVFEVCDAPATPGLGLITNVFAGESTTTNTPIDHVIFWHNVCVGGRVGFGYNSANSVLKLRRGWSMKNNYFDATACKTDVFNGTGGPNAIRQGNWPQVWGVGHSGNIQGGNTDVGPAGLDLEFVGISSIDTGAINSNYAHFLNRQAYAGSGAAPGQGDYHLTILTPYLGLPVDRPLPFDLEGTAWDNDTLAVGPYAYGSSIPPTANEFLLLGKTIKVQGKTLKIR